MDPLGCEHGESGSRAHRFKGYHKSQMRPQMQEEEGSGEGERGGEERRGTAREEKKGDFKQRSHKSRLKFVSPK